MHCPLLANRKTRWSINRWYWLGLSRGSISVTRCWNKSGPIFPKVTTVFLLKKWCVSKYPKNHQLFGLLLWENLLSRSMENHPFGHTGRSSKSGLAFMTGNNLPFLSGAVSSIFYFPHFFFFASFICLQAFMHKHKHTAIKICIFV